MWESSKKMLQGNATFYSRRCSNEAKKNDQFKFVT
jgi:hypothetical protein